MKLRPFELVLVVVFGTLMFVALILLRTYDAPPDENVSQVGAISIWGVLPDATFNKMLSTVRDSDEGFKQVTYRYIPEENFDEVFVNALADQTPPDLLLIPHDRLIKHRARLEAIPYESFPVRDFRSMYIDGASIFTLSDGVYGFPIAVDPLLMYWNRDIFTSGGFLVAPTTWEEVVGDTVPTLTVRNFNRKIERSALAMGEYSNIKNAFPLLSLLLLQGGSSLVTESQNQYKILINQSVSNSAATPFANAATFFTNFSNTQNTLYSWNRSLTLDRDMFLSEDLALYFGFASEGKELEAKNPNLSFDVAEVPQGQTATVKRTYGTYYGLVVPKAAKNKTGSFTVMQKIGNQENAKLLADGYQMAPVHRATLLGGSNDIYGRIAYISANYARGWLSPDSEKLDTVFTTMLDDINANRSDISSATNDAIGRIQQLYY